MRISDQEYTLEPQHCALGKRETSEQGSRYPEAAAVQRSQGGEGMPITTMARGRRKKHVKRGAKIGPWASLFASFGSVYPHTWRMSFPLFSK